jgi:hypothetical protein
MLSMTLSLSLQILIILRQLVDSSSFPSLSSPSSPPSSPSPSAFHFNPNSSPLVSTIVRIRIIVRVKFSSASDRVRSRVT